MDAPYDFAANGWQPHDDRGFIGHVGPIWQRDGPDGPVLAFQAAPKHENLRGVVQGGMLMTLADRTLGAFARASNAYRPQATVQLDVQFLAAVRIGAVVVGHPRLLRDTRALMFLDGEFRVGDTRVLTAQGIWKKLDT